MTSGLTPGRNHGVREFELLDEARHHHLICLACRHMTEFDDVLVEPLRAQIRNQYGFEAGIDHLALFGICPGCAEQISAGVLTAPVDTEPGQSVYSLNH